MAYGSLVMEDLAFPLNTLHKHQILRSIRAKKPEILDAIRNDKQITPDTETKLKAALDTFSASFA